MGVWFAVNLRPFIISPVNLITSLAPQCNAGALAAYKLYTIIIYNLYTRFFRIAPKRNAYKAFKAICKGALVPIFTAISTHFYGYNLHLVPIFTAIGTHFYGYQISVVKNFLIATFLYFQ